MNSHESKQYSLALSIYAGINFIQNHPPQGHNLKRAKTFLPGQSLCTKTVPSGQNRESKAPPPGHKVRKFHKYIYKLLTLLEMKSFVVSTNKTVFQ